VQPLCWKLKDAKRWLMTEFIPDLYAAACAVAAVAYVFWVFASRRKASLAEFEVSAETIPHALVGDACGNAGDLSTGVAERDLQR
jgi:hypothetical protein